MQEKQSATRARSSSRRPEEVGQRSSHRGGEQKNKEQVDVRKNSQGRDPRTQEEKQPGMGPKDPYKLVSNIRVGESDDRSVRAVTVLQWAEDEVINTESSDRAERPAECRGRVLTTKKIEKIVEVYHREVGHPSHRHGQFEVLPWNSAVFTKSADKLEKEMTRDLDVNFNDIITRLGKKIPRRNCRTTPRKLRTRG